MIDREHDLPLSRQAKVLNLSRSTVYYKPRPVSVEDLSLMCGFRFKPAGYSDLKPAGIPI